MLKVSTDVHIIWKGNIKKQMTGEVKRLDCLSVTLSWLLLLLFFSPSVVSTYCFFFPLPGYFLFIFLV